MLVKLTLEVYAYFVTWQGCVMTGNGPSHGDDLTAWNKWSTLLPESEGDQPIPTADMFRVIESSKDSKFDIDYLGESTKGDMNVRPEAFEYGDSQLQEVAASIDDSLEEIAKAEAKEAEALLDALKIPVNLLFVPVRVCLATSTFFIEFSGPGYAEALIG